MLSKLKRKKIYFLFSIKSTKHYNNTYTLLVLGYISDQHNLVIPFLPILDNLIKNITNIR